MRSTTTLNLQPFRPPAIVAFLVLAIALAAPVQGGEPAADEARWEWENVSRVVAVGALVTFAVGATLEVAARRAWAKADGQIVRSGLLAEGRIDEAVELLDTMLEQQRDYLGYIK